MMDFYIDTSIWIDLLEDRKDYNGKPLGEYALKLFSMIKEKHTIILSDAIYKELNKYYANEEIKGLFLAVNTRKIFSTENQMNEAKRLANERKIPKGDCLHAILARDTQSILVTRDKHFKLLEDIQRHHKPEDII